MCRFTLQAIQRYMRVLLRPNLFFVPAETRSEERRAERGVDPNRDFPFDRLGLLATVMARCAPPKRYFGFIDVLFQKQADWSRSQDPFAELSRIGKLGGLNPSDFDACLKNQELIDGLVEKRLEGQKKFDVNATPTFIIDGDHKIVGSQPYEEFEKVFSKKAK